jgi:hypothetical protein
VFYITFKKVFFRGIICAGHPNNIQGSCYGDSGGPMVKFVHNVEDSDEQSYFVQIGKYTLTLFMGNN